MFEQAFKRLDNHLNNDDGISTELEYVEQSSWLLFLKYLDDLEIERQKEAELGEKYRPILEEKFRWSAWAMPKKADGSPAYDKIKTGESLIDFVNKELFPYLAGFKGADGVKTDTIEHKIGEIFSQLENKIESGNCLRECLEDIDELAFASQSDLHELSSLYEVRINRMGNAGRNGGEFYTPRPLIRAMLKVVKPEIGETICDPATGSAGFLCESYDYLYKEGISGTEFETLQKRTLYGQEKKVLPYVIGMMNMILHGVETPNLARVNTLSEKLTDIQDDDKYDIILANPPFKAGGEGREIQQNFDIRSSEPAYLFLQFFIRSLKPGGRAGIVIKNTFLSNNDVAATSLRELLLKSCNLHTILECPRGVFQAGVETVVLFFEKGSPTEDIWYYTLDPGRTLGKTRPLTDKDMAEFVSLQPERKESEKSWIVSIDDVDTETCSLTPRNPNKPQEAPLRAPSEIVREISAIDKESAEILNSVRGLL
ncbi:MAG: type I restriction-modification system subunit M [Alphaproteobacteria bacterium]|nr:type I restriction-modification system subunit M [Alphaproteobacteria bacterium]MDA8013135.1 type I restriction-modification system subunit M [Alphaproteobacteria bacterium]